jgi:hypothetical protein
LFHLEVAHNKYENFEEKIERKSKGV